jgi:hypothetical protein
MKSKMDAILGKGKEQIASVGFEVPVHRDLIGKTQALN